MTSPKLDRLVLLAVALVTAGCESPDDDAPAESPARDDRPNIVLVLTDDQRWDTLSAMPIVLDRLVERGVHFRNAFVTIAECCPSRASLLSGGFHVQQTGVKSNAALNGAMSHFNDRDSLPLHLQRSGFATGLVGRYLIGHEAPYVPPGWTSFVVNDSAAQASDWHRLRKITVGSSREKPEGGHVRSVDQYITDFQRDEAADFIRSYADRPFFLVLSTFAPHSPRIPSEEDLEAFADYAYSGRSLGEEDLSDKPRWIRERALAIGASPCGADVPVKDRQALQAVDRAVGAVLDTLEELDLDGRTYVFFTSDNGLTYGEHRLRCNKGLAYEESIRVPLVVRGPGVKRGRSEARQVAMNLDVAATIAELANLPPRGDGRSLVPLLHGKDPAWRGEILLESYGHPALTTGRVPPVWAGLRVAEDGEVWKYVEHAGGDLELYDLVKDPYELESLHADTRHAERIETFRARLADQSGLAITSFEPPPARAGERYRFELAAWGGTPPYTWDLVEGKLPRGLTLDGASGRVTGTPARTGSSEVRIRVTDSAIAAYSGKAQEFLHEFLFEVGE